MAFLAFFSPNRRDRIARRRQRRRLKSLPLLALFGATIFAVRALVVSLTTLTTLGISTAYVDVSLPIELAKRESATDANANTISTTATLRTINGWQRMKPSHGGTVYGEFDPLTTGKSCRWEPTSFYYPKKVLSWIFFFSRASFLGTWICRDCGQYPSVSWESCPVLKPRRKCPAFEYQGWEEPRPRSASTYDPFSSSPYPVRLITSYGVGKFRKIEYEQPQCLSLRKPCFDMDRCTAPAKAINGTTTSDRKLIQPLPVFAYRGQARIDLKDAIDGRDIISSDLLEDFIFPTTSIRIVEDPRMACLLISHADDLNSAKESFTWNLGVNHYVYGVTKPISENVHYDMAALGSVAITEAQLRPEYDIPLPLPAIWKLRDQEPNSRRKIRDLHRPRKYLLTFKGSIQDTLQPYYQHRWLAAEYIYQEPDVAIDVQCKHKTIWGNTVTFAHYDNPSQENFDDLMVNATFAFCPGGSHVTSFRFTEVLSAGAIPVLLPEIVTPFYPEVDWSGCAIRVSQARIVDLPRVLRAIPPEEIRDRQLQCSRLFQKFLRVHDHDSSEETPDAKSKVPTSAGYLAAALKVWHLRLEKQYHGDQLVDLLTSSSTNDIDR
jgi:hypothetical protein